MEKSSGDYEVFNVGSGKPVTILEVAGVISRLLKSSIKPDITGKARKLDVRHCYADLKKIKKLLGWSPKIKLLEGFAGLIEWGKYEKARDKVDYALGELEKRGLR